MVDLVSGASVPVEELAAVVDFIHKDNPANWSRLVDCFGGSTTAGGFGTLTVVETLSRSNVPIGTLRAVVTCCKKKKLQPGDEDLLKKLTGV